jgi:hypothetical protein
VCKIAKSVLHEDRADEEIRFQYYLNNDNSTVSQKPAGSGVKKQNSESSKNQTGSAISVFPRRPRGLSGVAESEDGCPAPLSIRSFLLYLI